MGSTRMHATINCDMGEGFGLYRMGDDAALMPLIDLANVACGFHGSDPTIMRATVQLGKRHGGKVGAHPSLPDLQGFGRRAMAVTPEEVTDLVTYQTGALMAFIEAENMRLNHVKPHGALYGMAARDRLIAGAIAIAVRPFGVPILGMAFTEQEIAYREHGFELIPEFYADLEYDGAGNLILSRVHEPVDPAKARERTLRALRDGGVTTTAGQDIAVKPKDCMCSFRYTKCSDYRRRTRSSSTAKVSRDHPAPNCHVRAPSYYQVLLRSRRYTVRLVPALAIIFVIFASSASAQEPALPEAQKLVELLSTSLLDDMTSQILKPMSANLEASFQGKIDDATKTELFSELERITKKYVAQGLEKAPAIYAKYFSASELRDIAAFYKTPSGSKALSLMPKVMGDFSSTVLVPLMQPMQVEMQTAMQTVLRKHNVIK